MDTIDRYLNAVAAQLPQDERADILAELRDLILSRFEAKEEEVGRPLGEEEQEAILREIGHPLVVAARYRKGPDSLVGPELFPYWLFGVKAGLLILLVVQSITLFIHLVTGPANAGQSITQAFHGYFGSALALIGAATVAAAAAEHYGVRPKWLTQWRVKDLGAFGLSDPAAWGAAVAGMETPKAHPAPRKSETWPGGEHLFSLLATGLFLLWWIGLIHLPALGQLGLRGEDATVTGAPIWTRLFLPILIYGLIRLSIDLDGLLRPQAIRMRAVGEAALAAAGLWLTWTIFQAGHWFTLERDGQKAHIAGDWLMLDFDRLRDLADGPRDLVGVAGTLSLVAVWVLALIAISLAWKMFANLWRAARAA